MPKIPLYQQGELASSVVGTPPMDRSGEILGSALFETTNALASGIEKNQRESAAIGLSGYRENLQLSGAAQQYFLQNVGQAITGIASDVHSRMLQHQYEVAHATAIRNAADKALQESMNKATVSNASVPLGYQLDDLYNEAQQTNIATPAEATNYFREQAPQKVKDFLDAHPDIAQNTIQANALQEFANSRILQHSASLDTFAKDQSIKNQISETKQNLKSIADQAPGRGLEATWQAFKQVDDAALHSLGAQGPVEIRNAKREALWNVALDRIKSSSTPDQIDSARKFVDAITSIGNHPGVEREKQDEPFFNQDQKDSLLTKLDAQASRVNTQANLVEDNNLLQQQHELMRIRENSNLTPDNPDYKANSLDGIDKLNVMMKQVDSQPQTKQTLTLKRDIQSEIDKMQSQVKEFDSARKAEDKAATAEEKANAKEKAKAAKEDAQTKWNSFSEDRVKLFAELDDIHNIHESGQPKNAVTKSGMPVEKIDDAELFRRVKRVTDDMNKLHAAGGLTRPGAGDKDKWFENKSAFLREVSDRIVRRENKPSLMESWFGAASKDAPDFVLNALNPDRTGDKDAMIRTQYSNYVDRQIKLYTDHMHKQPDAKYIRNVIHFAAIKKVLGIN